MSEGFCKTLLLIFFPNIQNGRGVPLGKEHGYAISIIVLY